MKPAEVTLTSVVSGDTWNGISEIAVQVNGSAPEAALQSVEMAFRAKTAPSRVDLRLTSDDGITIDDAANWQMSVPPRVMTLNPGIYLWSMTTTDADGVEKTYIKGTIEVLRA